VRTSNGFTVTSSRPIIDVRIRPTSAAVRRFRDTGVWRDAGQMTELHRWRDDTPDALAIKACRADGDAPLISYAELARHVERFAGALYELGDGQERRWPASCRADRVEGLFVHAGLTTGQTVVVHGAAGGVGSIALQLAREVGAQVIGTGRTDDRDVVLGLGAQAFLDLDADPLEGIGEVDAVFDVIGGDVLERSTALVPPGGTLVTITMPPTV
jgi:hypothetical protein